MKKSIRLIDSFAVAAFLAAALTVDVSAQNAAPAAATPATTGAAAAPAAGAAAAAPAAAGARAGRGGGGTAVNSPEVNVADHTFTVRFRAPNATAVSVIGEIDGKEHPMTKGDNGIWSVTVGPLPPDVYNYQIRADGIVTMDPVNPQIKIGFGGFPPANMVEIPGPESAFQDTRDVPHGSIRVETYHSKEFGGAPRTLWVYTPPGYDAGTSRYPVFYLLNGSGNTDSSWILTGRANTILDNLIADGKAKPMILVSPMGYARTGVGTGPDRTFDTTGQNQNNGENFWYLKEFMGDIIPYVDGKFRTLTDADNRAIGGLSMGGGHTVAIGFANPDTFHSIVVMSAGANGGGGGAGGGVEAAYPKIFGDPAVTNKKLKFLWVGAGGNDMALAGAQALDAALTAKGINHQPFWTLPGARHEWVVWRHALNDVAPKLFR